MTTLRNSIPIIRSGSIFLSSRQFHSISNLWAKARLKKSPAIQAKLRQTPVVPSRPSSNDISKNLPPITLLDSAHKSGGLPIDSQKAISVLRRFQELGATRSLGWEQKLCTEFGIEPSTLVPLAHTLLRCGENKQHQLGIRVMSSASNLGVASATIFLMQIIHHKGASGGTSYSALLHRLGMHAKNEENLEAMSLLGKVLLSQQKEKEALEWFRKASQGPAETLNSDTVREALVNIGQILLSWKDKEGAIAAFRKAALELEDPNAYFYLSQVEEPGSPQQEAYLIKAAASGVVEACHNLGSIELARMEKHEIRPKSFQDYGMAREWFQVAAASGFGLSMLNLALMCRAVGQSDAGLHWLDKAEMLPEVREESQKLREHWEDPSALLQLPNGPSFFPSPTPRRRFSSKA